MDNRASRRLRSHHAKRACLERALPLPGFLIAAIIALVLQSLVVQTHIHRWSKSLDGSAVATDSQGTEQPPIPGDGRDSIDCALCQHGPSGPYLAPTGVVTGLPGTANAESVALGESASSPRARSHSW